MFAISTVRTLIESQFSGDHPLRLIRTQMRELLRGGRKQACVADIERKDMIAALMWRGLYAIPSEQLLKEAMRFDLRCQWFLGFCMEPSDWRHAEFIEAMTAYLDQADTQRFFGEMLFFLKENGLLTSQVLDVDIELLENWAEPGRLNGADAMDIRKTGCSKRERKDWRSFSGKAGKRIDHAATDWCAPGYNPNNRTLVARRYAEMSESVECADEAARLDRLSKTVKRTENLAGLLSTTRALANTRPGAVAGTSILPGTSAPQPEETAVTDSKSLMESMFSDLMSR